MLKISIAVASAVLLVPGAAMAQAIVRAPAPGQTSASPPPPSTPNHSFIRGMNPSTQPPLRPVSPTPQSGATTTAGHVPPTAPSPQ